MTKTQCCVPHCLERGGHQFPKNENLRKKWMCAIRRDKWTPTRFSYVCQAHFLPMDYKATTIGGNVAFYVHFYLTELFKYFFYICNYSIYY
jgi:hypothetical protein